MNGPCGTTSAKTFDELRVEMYNKSTVSLDKLPPTSSVMRQHLIKGFNLVRRALTLLEPNKTTCITLARDLNGYRRTFLEFVAVTENAEGDVNVQLLIEFFSGKKCEKKLT